MNSRPETTDTNTDLRAAWIAEIGAALAARSAADGDAEWSHLERAHILSQPMAWPHVRTHVAMFTAALRRRDTHELIGQVFRVIAAAPGSITGKYPAGNPGGANVSAFAPMPIPDDLKPLLANTVKGS